jgi:predicted RNA-binding protein YlqC (UPF0109 family)
MASMNDGAGVKAVVEVLARALTDRPDDVRVVETEHRGTTLVELYVAPDDLGKVIGKQGRTAAALRALAASAAERTGKTVRRKTLTTGLQNCRIAELQKGSNGPFSLSAVAVLLAFTFCNPAILQFCNVSEVGSVREVG